MNAIGKNVRARREAAGMTQKQLAQAVGVKQAMISHIEVGERLPSLPLAIQLADALGVTVDALYSTQEVA